MHLNLFHHRPHTVTEIDLPCLKDVYKDKTRLHESHFLLYGPDASLSRMHTYKMVCPVGSEMSFKESSATVDGVEILFLRHKNVVELNLKTHLNKEKSAMIEYIKSQSSSRTADNSRHIFVLLNLDYLNSSSQFKMRKVVENSWTTSTFVCTTTSLSRVIDPLSSRFTCVRVPELSIDAKTALCNRVLSSCDDDDDHTTQPLKSKKRSKTTSSASASCSALIAQEKYQDVVLGSLSMEMFVGDSRAYARHGKSFQILDNGINTLLTKLKNRKDQTSISYNDVVTHIREFVYNIVHYNIDHRVFCKRMLHHVFNAVGKKTDDVLHHVTRLLTDFDTSIISVNACKMIHVYERLLLDISLVF